MTYLTELVLQHNALTGPIDENLFFLPQLRVLDLHSNQLTGTITESIGCAPAGSLRAMHALRTPCMHRARHARRMLTTPGRALAALLPAPLSGSRSALARSS